MPDEVPLLPRDGPPPGPRLPEPDLRFTFRVTGEGPPGIIRARRLLKWAWRSLGLLNVGFEEVPREKGGRPCP